MEKIGRRELLKKASTGAIGIGISTMFGCSTDPIAQFSYNGGGLEVGEGAVDITAPRGMEIAGFHRKPGNERRVTGVRHRAVTRALVLHLKGMRAAIVSLELCGIASPESCASLRRTCVSAQLTPIRCLCSVICASGEQRCRPIHI